MEQTSLFTPGTAGRETFTAQLLTRAADPEPSGAAAREAIRSGARVKDADRVLAWLRQWGPATSWELATLAADGDEKQALRLHYMISRRLPDIEKLGRVTCERQRDATGKTISTATKVCGVTGEVAIAWRVL